MRKITCLLLPLLLTFLNCVSVFAYTDDYILTDPVKNTFQGDTNYAAILKNISFKDVPQSHYAQEAITRMGAMEVLKGYPNNTFNPYGYITKEEAITIVIKVIGQESQAQAAAQALAPTITNPSTKTLWSLGYLKVASDLGLITPAQLTDALNPNQKTLDPNKNFIRTQKATREEVATWLIQALQTNNKNITLPKTYESIHGYDDWSNISINAVPYVEFVIANGIMGSTGTRNFYPKNGVRRGDLAIILKATDNYYFQTINVVKKSGTVAAIKDNTNVTTGSTGFTRSLYIRTADGTVDILQFLMSSNSSPLPKAKDTITYMNGKISGLSQLKQGDQIEYYANTAKKTVAYVLKTSAITQKSMTGKLDVIDTANNKITLRDMSSQTKTYTYTTAAGLLTDTTKNITALQTGNIVKVTLVNNVVTDVTFIGDTVVDKNIHGYVTDNDVNLQTITIVDEKGNLITKKYNGDEVIVTKQPYNQIDDEVGYFPNFHFNPNAATMEDIEAGDIVYLKINPYDSNYITEASAVTNYTIKYGKVKRITKKGAEGADMLLQYEDGRTGFLTVAPGVSVWKDGYPKTTEDISEGDWIRTLVNEEILEPGNTLDVVKEVVIEGSEHFISRVVSGQLGSINKIQQKISIQNAQTLSKAGWTNYNQLTQLDISAKDAMYYYNGKPISLDTAISNFKRSDITMYVAMESYYGSERVRKVLFSGERDEALDPDTVVNADGNGTFSLGNTDEAIHSDDGTIVIRYGRLVDQGTIFTGDYGQVVLNGESKGAVVNIQDPPSTDNITIIRGLVQSIDDGKTFQVSSMYMLSGMNWSPTPVSRVFTIDNNTKYITASGVQDISTFTGIGASNQVDKFFTIITDGTKATKIIDAPKPYLGVRGTVVNTDGTTITLKDITTYQTSTGKWVSSPATTAITVTVPVNGIVSASNKIVKTADIKIGDQIRVMNDNMPTITQGAAVTGYFIFVEK